jgi:hypothetical protein
MGLIATGPILRGSLILANTASYLFDYRAYNSLPKSQYTTLQTSAINHLPLPHHTALLNLSSSHNAHPPQNEHILASNIFDIDPAPDDPTPSNQQQKEEEEEYHGFAALFPAISRINHDCRPNADYRFDHAALAQYVHAARDIAQGEEITVSYIDPLMAREARLGRLRANWGFECSCALCALDGGRRVEAEERRGVIGEVRERLGGWDWDEDGASGGSTREGVGMAELLIGLFEMERLWTVMHEAYVFAALEYSAVGERWMAVKYARLAVEWGIPMVGEEDEDVKEMREFVKDPRGHWSWMRRVRGGAEERG